MLARLILDVFAAYVESLSPVKGFLGACHSCEAGNEEHRYNRKSSRVAPDHVLVNAELDFPCRVDIGCYAETAFAFVELKTSCQHA